MHIKNFKNEKKLKKQNRTSLRSLVAIRNVEQVDTSNGTKIIVLIISIKMCMVLRKSEKRNLMLDFVDSRFQ